MAELTLVLRIAGQGPERVAAGSSAAGRRVPM